MSWNEVAVTSDATNSAWNTVIWNCTTGSIVAKCKSGNSCPRGLAFIKDSLLIAGLINQKALNVWPINDTWNKVKLKIDCVGPVCALAVSPQGRYCVGAIASKLYLWEIPTGELIGIFCSHYQNVTCIKFSDDAQYFISGGADSLTIVWNLGQILHEAEERPNEFEPFHLWNDHSSAVTDIHIGQTSRQTKVATVSEDKICIIHDLLSGIRLYTIVTEEPLYSVVMDPLERVIFLGTGSGSIIKKMLSTYYSGSSVAISKNHCKLLQGHSNSVTCLDVSFDGIHLLSGSNDATAIVWHIRGSRAVHRFKHEGPVTNAFFKLWHADMPAPSDMAVKPFKFVRSSFDSLTYDCVCVPYTSTKRKVIDDVENCSCLEKFNPAKRKTVVCEPEKTDIEKNEDLYMNTTMAVLNTKLH